MSDRIVENLEEPVGVRGCHAENGSCSALRACPRQRHPENPLYLRQDLGIPIDIGGAAPTVEAPSQTGSQPVKKRLAQPRWDPFVESLDLLRRLGVAVPRSQRLPGARHTSHDMA